MGGRAGGGAGLGRGSLSGLTAGQKKALGWLKEDGATISELKNFVSNAKANNKAKISKSNQTLYAGQGQGGKVMTITPNGNNGYKVNYTVPGSFPGDKGTTMHKTFKSAAGAEKFAKSLQDKGWGW